MLSMMTPSLSRVSAAVIDYLLSRCYRLCVSHRCHETLHRAHRTALKYGAASCGEEYTPGNDHVGFN